MKSCIKCRVLPRVTHSRWCRNCRADYQRTRIKYRWSVLKRFKKIKGCNKCGYNKCSSALQFNHIDPSTKTHHLGIGRLIKGLVRWQRIKDELAKCEVLCANCHAELTHENKHHLLGAKDEK